LFFNSCNLISEFYILKVEYNSRRTIDVFVNGDRIEFDEQTRLDFSEVFIVKNNQSKINVHFTSGVSIDIRAIEEFLVYQISIPTRFKGLYVTIEKFEDVAFFRQHKNHCYNSISL
jgi:hypothetical protein